MPSDLLKKSIADAKALRETALKSAEQAVLEKYSHDVRSTLKTLLEGPFDDLDEEKEEDSLGDMGLGGDGEGGGALGLAAGEDPMGMDGGPIDSPVMDELPYSHTDGQDEGCACPDEDEEIEIDFDALDSMADDDMGMDDPMSGGDELGGMGEDDPFAGLDDEEKPPGNRDDDLSSYYNKRSKGPKHPWDESDSFDDFGLETDQDMSIPQFSEEEDDDELGLPMRRGKRNRFYESADPKEAKLLEEFNQAMERLEEKAKNKKQQQMQAIIQEMLDEELKAIVAKMDEVVKENKTLQESLEKHKSAVSKLKGKLEETLLSNAKLLYQNRALGNASLNERQKKSIVENISKARSPEEAKSLYEMLSKSAGTVSKPSGPQSLTEAVERRSNGIIKPRKEATYDPSWERMQRLAGIK